MKTHSGVTDETRLEVGQILNLLLADEFVIYVATRDFHWDVTGSEFSGLHQLFEEQYKQLEDWINQLAGRARAIGAWTRDGWPELIKAARLSADTRAELPAADMLTKLLDLHEHQVVQLQKDLGACAHAFRDAGTADLLTGLIAQHERNAWLLRTQLEAAEAEAS